MQPISGTEALFDGKDCLAGDVSPPLFGFGNFILITYVIIKIFKKEGLYRYPIKVISTQEIQASF